MATSAPAGQQPTEPPIVANRLPNGVNGSSSSSSSSSANINININGHRPHTPSLSGLSLTEYSANPSPPSEDKRIRIKKTVPDEFLLPTGYPDVCICILCSLCYAMLSLLVLPWACHVNAIC